MRYAIFSDVHSNLEALEAVLAELQKERFDLVLCGGDLVGYGPNPSECLKRLKEAKAQMVCGNHDRAVAGALPLNWFNPHAREAILWTKRQLGEDEQDFLRSLPLIREDSALTLVHGSLCAPGEFHYVLDAKEARACLELQKTPLAFIGHTHVPGIFVQGGDTLSFVRRSPMPLSEEARYLVNVGSVGQPRDGDPRACYCVYDTEAKAVEFRRVSYAVDQVQKKMIQAGLPDFLIRRLGFGY